MDYVKNILKIAKEKGLTNKQLCELLGKNPSYITDWKNGKSKPKADEIILLADYFNVSADYLLGKTNTPTQEQIGEFARLVTKMSPDEQQKVKEYMEFLISQRERKQTNE